MKTLLPVPPADIAAVWPRVRPGLESMEKGDGWLPEDIYLALKTNGASLHMVAIDGKEHGFIVLRVLHDFDGPRLHIWVLHSHSKIDVMTEFDDELTSIAKSINAGRITFSSTRSGWAKVAPKHGFRVRETVYERKIQS
jgi:hypothetical protein